jgi:hypothetical protein
VRYLSIYDFAKETGHSVKHIYEQVRLGKIAAKKIDGKWKITERELAAWKARK